MASVPTEQLIARGKECLARNDVVGAIAALREAGAREPKYADVRNLLGIGLSLAGELEAAVAEFTRAVELNPGYVEAHLNRAIVLNELGRFDEAQEAFRRAWESEDRRGLPYPKTAAARLANVHAELGDLYLEVGGRSEAITQYRAATQLRPDFVDLRNKLARALIEAGDLEAARTELEAVLAQNPEYAEARVNLGLIHYRWGDEESAAREWRLCLERKPDHSRARAFLKMLGRQRAEGSS
ncbi:MAG: tetratricopeptide repeat protein [Gemmatimonadetes bacterium]|nr:tetratricopeptide repeat protein [Gemmatimonadota bacterium]